MRIAVLMLLVCVVGWSCDKPGTPEPQATQQPAKPAKVADWTPEQIVAAPEDYLVFCEHQCKNALAILKARQMTIESSRATFQQEHDRESAAIREAEPVLKQLRDLSASAAASGKWPVTWAGEPRTQEWVRNTITELEVQVDVKNKMLTVYEKGLTDLREEQAKNPRDQAAALLRLAEIKKQKGMLGVDRQNKAYQQQLLAMQAQVISVEDSANSHGVVSLDTLSKNQPVNLSTDKGTR